MKLLPLQTNSGVYMNGLAPLRTGMATSLLLIGAGFFMALIYILVWGRGLVWLSPLCAWWISLSCAGGGLMAGLRGGPGVWWPAGQIGVLGGGLVLVLLALVAPESLGFGDLLTYVLLPAGLSCGGALAGANLLIRSARSRAVGRRGAGNTNPVSRG